MLWESCPSVPSFWEAPPALEILWLVPAEPARPTSSSPDTPSCLTLASLLAAHVPPLVSLKALWDVLLQCADLSPACWLLWASHSPWRLLPCNLSLQRPHWLSLRERRGQFVLEAYSNTSLHHHSLSFPCPSHPWYTDDLLLRYCLADFACVLISHPVKLLCKDSFSFWGEASKLSYLGEEIYLVLF